MRRVSPILLLLTPVLLSAQSPQPQRHVETVMKGGKAYKP